MIAQPMLEQEVFAENMDPRKGGLRYGIRRREAMSVNYYVGVISIAVVILLYYIRECLRHGNK